MNSHLLEKYTLPFMYHVFSSGMPIATENNKQFQIRLSALWFLSWIPCFKDLWFIYFSFHEHVFILQLFLL